MHRFLRPALEAAGYAVERADTAAEGLRLARLPRAGTRCCWTSACPTWMGRRCWPALRGFSAVPVIVLSARDREADKIAALDGGADDYVEKAVRRGRAAGPHTHRAAPSPRAGRRARGGTPARAGDRPGQAAGQHAGRPAGAEPSANGRCWCCWPATPAGCSPHRQLLTAIWGPAHTEDVQYLRVYIGQLRQKLGPCRPADRNGVSAWATAWPTKPDHPPRLVACRRRSERQDPRAALPKTQPHTPDRTGQGRGAGGTARPFRALFAIFRPPARQAAPECLATPERENSAVPPQRRSRPPPRPASRRASRASTTYWAAA